jgi:hypothetical protein
MQRLFAILRHFQFPLRLPTFIIQGAANPARISLAENVACEPFTQSLLAEYQQ